jgi:hypothetical protein
MREFWLTPCITLHNVVHRHFLWFKVKAGYRDSSRSRQYAVPEISATESDDEPIMCGIAQYSHSSLLKHLRTARYENALPRRLERSCSMSTQL